MNIYIVRHAEPDYTIDSLTEKGWREAELLSRRLSKITPAHYYVSPLGRARDTASLTLKAVGAEAEECWWLREFHFDYKTDASVNPFGLAWDMLPRLWTNDPVYYDPERWFTGPLYRDTSVGSIYKKVIAEFDAFLARHGYVREGGYYRAEHANRDNLILFCHFGVECVLLSRLMNCSPMVPWHFSVALPSSVTVISTEEREEGRAVFRMSRFGDLSHLDAAGEEPSFAARFCETFAQENQRH